MLMVEAGGRQSLTDQRFELCQPETSAPGTHGTLARGQQSAPNQIFRKV